MDNLEQLIETLAEDTKVVQPAPHPFLLSLKWMSAILVYVFVLLAVTGFRPDLIHKLHEPLFAAEIASLFSVFVATSISAALLAFPDLHQKRVAASSPVLMLALLMLSIVFAWHADSAPIPVHTYECTACIFLVAFLPAALMFYSMRKLASTNRLAGSIVLLCAFSIGALWLRLHEINDSIVHVIQWHYLPMFVFGLLGYWIGKALLKW